jgi:N-acetylmuramoyl-L-alanine amidase
MAAAGFHHTVASGDCIGSIADRNGHFWQTLWDAPENASLKERRKDPNVLEPGDQVFVPPLRPKFEDRATEATHRFKKRGVPAKLRMHLLLGGHPRKNTRFVATIDGTPHEGTTDAEGFLEIDIPPQAQSGILTLHARSGIEHYTLNLGALDPIDTTRGVQQRLLNMGIECAVTGELDDQTREALATFLSRQGDAPSDDTRVELTDDLRTKIKTAHGA